MDKEEKSRELSRARAKRYYESHKAEIAQRTKEYRQNNREHYNALRRNDKNKNPAYTAKKYQENVRIREALRISLRKEIFALRGGVCESCGFQDWRAFQIDHVEGGGGQERKAKRNAIVYLRDVLASIQADENQFMVLCTNCHQIKHCRYDL